MISLLIASASVALGQCPPTIFQVPAFGAPGAEIDPWAPYSFVPDSFATFDADGPRGPNATQALVSVARWGRLGTASPPPFVAAWSGAWSTFAGTPVTYPAPMRFKIWNDQLVSLGSQCVSGYREGQWQYIPAGVCPAWFDYPRSFFIFDDAIFVTGDLGVTNPITGLGEFGWARFANGVWRAVPPDTNESAPLLHNGIWHRARDWRSQSPYLAERWTGTTWVPTNPTGQISAESMRFEYDQLVSSQGRLFRSVASSEGPRIYEQTATGWSRMTVPALRPELTGRTTTALRCDDSPYGLLIVYASDSTTDLPTTPERHTRRIARYNQGQWSDFPGVFTLASLERPPGRSPIVGLLLSYGDELIAFGEFDRVDGRPALNAAVFNGSMWTATAPGMMRSTLDEVGQAAPTRVLQLFDWYGDILVSGTFSVVCGDGSEARDTAIFDGAGWRAFQPALPLAGEINSYVIYRGEPHVTIYGASQWGTYRLRDGQWQRLPVDIDNLQTWQDKLVGLCQVGDRAGLAIWDGADENATIVVRVDPLWYFGISGFAVLNDTLYITQGNYLWQTNGLVWTQTSQQSLPSRLIFDRPLRTVANNIYCLSGDFFGSASVLHVWTGTAFVPAAGPAPIAELFMHQNALHAVMRDNRITRLDAGGWTTVVNADPGTRTALSAHGMLYLGDDSPLLVQPGFPTGYPQPAELARQERLGNLAIYGSPAPPAIRSQDTLVEATNGAAAQFRIIHDGIALSSIRWLRDGQPVNLSDMRISARTALDGRTHTLRFRNTVASDSGEYTAELIHRCGSVISQRIVLVTPGAPTNLCDSIDFNNNGIFPEDQDVIDFFVVLAGGACSTGMCNDIDVNNNAVFPEDSDVIDFFALLAGGTCS